MSASRQWGLHDHSRCVVVSTLKLSLLQEGKTQTEPCLNVLTILDEQITEDLFSLRVFAFANCFVAFGVSLLIAEAGSNIGWTGECRTKHEGGHTEGRHPEKAPIVIALHNSHLLT